MCGDSQTTFEKESQSRSTEGETQNKKKKKENTKHGSCTKVNFSERSLHLTTQNKTPNQSTAGTQDWRKRELAGLFP